MAANTGQRKRVDSKRWPGVYDYESADQKFQGKPDTCLYITFKVDGKKVWEKVGWKSEGYTPQVAAELRANRMKQIRHGEEVKTSKEIQCENRAKNRAIAEIAEAYFHSKGDSLKGLTTDRNRWEKHLLPLVGDLPAGRLSELDITRVKHAMQGHAAATVWNALELLRRIVNFGARAGYCPPLTFVIKMPRKDNEVVEYLAPEEAARLLQVLEHWPTQDVPRMLKLAMFTGMRRGEIFKLQDRDLDFHAGFITIRSPKGGKTVSVPMNPVASEILKAQATWRDEHFHDSPYLFPGKGGGLRTDSNAVDRIKLAADLPKEFRIFHGLRHHYAVTLANSGKVTLDMIGELLTHKSAAMTKRYGQFLPHTIKEAGNLAAELIQAAAQVDSTPPKQKKVAESAKR